MGDDFVQQADGRMVAGPPLPDWSKEKATSELPIFIAFGLALAFLLVGVFIGRGTVSAPETTWQDLYATRIQDGCLPLGLIVGVGKQVETDRLTEALALSVSAIRSEYPDAESIETHLASIPQMAHLRQANPNAELVAYVTLERCLD